MDTIKALELRLFIKNAQIHLKFLNGYIAHVPLKEVDNEEMEVIRNSINAIQDGLNKVQRFI